MATHRRQREERLPGVEPARRRRSRLRIWVGRRMLAFGRVELAVLAFCLVGLLGSWLLYAGTTAHPPAGQVPALHAAAAPATGSPEPPAPSPAGNASPAARSTAAAGKTSTAGVPGRPGSAPQRIVYPDIGMDVPVHPLKPSSSDVESQSIVPPVTLDGYWLTPYGMPGSGSRNTTYVVGHSWEGLDAPFNRLSTRAGRGDVFTVHTAAGQLKYRVDSVTTYTKSTLKDSPIWDVVPNRLVLISCYTEDLWGRNVAVVASPAGA
ncbi:class F sortase [Arthrobacter sp. SAFR-014]|uniref:class F sortase n=1 Tax=unclassified Arthrobacter TaxID=235627 RepID=UPI003F7C9E98